MNVKHEEAFTLIEMMIVLLIISILLLIAIPNMTKSNSIVKEKTCESTVDLLTSQVAAYEMETGNNITDLNELVPDYADKVTCPGGEELTLDGDQVKITE